MFTLLLVLSFVSVVLVSAVPAFLKHFMKDESKLVWSEKEGMYVQQSNTAINKAIDWSRYAGAVLMLLALTMLKVALILWVVLAIIPVILSVIRIACLALVIQSVILYLFGKPSRSYI